MIRGRVLVWVRDDSHHQFQLAGYLAGTFPAYVARSGSVRVDEMGPSIGIAKRQRFARYLSRRELQQLVAQFTTPYLILSFERDDLVEDDPDNPEQPEPPP